MARFGQMRDRLPTLYRPEDGDTGLLTPILRSVADALEELNRTAGDAMQAHWFGYADRAQYDAYFMRGRELAGLPYPDPTDLALVEFPYVHDLARLGSLLLLPPWQEPLDLRETVEEYRQRIGRIVMLYRNGLATVYALRGMVEAQLPVELEAAPEDQDRPFWLEEFAPLVRDSLAVKARGEPTDMVGPLMRWTVVNDGLEATPPTLYISGVEPREGSISATTNPLIELYRHGEELSRLGIAYRGTVGPGQTLRLRPAFSSWIGLNDGIRRSEALPTETHPADPTAPGPWLAVAGAPEGTVVAVEQTHDRALWAAVNTGDGGALHRFDGQEWEEALTDLSPLRCLAGDGQSLLMGTDTGLLRMPLYPEATGDFTANPVPDAGPVRVLFRAADGVWWLGTDGGAARLETGGMSFFGLGADEETAIAVHAISQDRGGVLYFGTQRGLFQYQPGTGHWYWYEGEEHSEHEPDWERFRPEEQDGARNFPTEERVFLPPVRCVHRGPDSSLWMGTDNGIARYVAHSVGGRGYTTLLEAFPHLTTGRVFAIEEDARGLVWFCTESGLLRHDGRDFWQFQDDGWVRLGRTDTPNGDAEPVFWRFHRPSSRWQRFDRGTSDWVPFTGASRAEEQATVRAVVWTDQVSADLGGWDGARFTNPAPVAASDLLVRHKPAEERIVTGGIPTIPRLPVGRSEWRYLSLEPEDVAAPEDRPSWTIEGRLLPPPSDEEATEEGRYDLDGGFDRDVFAFEPAARVAFGWEPRRPLTVLARLKQRSADEHIPPGVVDRVWQGMQQVRPAGVRAALAVEEEIVRGGDDG